ncbi:secreted protein containing Cellulosome anchoring protein, cohesin region domain protein [Candidatus Magnetomorum sp. HK-1]|nr:secreted protein containing Cellulosome anchoring protein, cohesin region domain protein [Candidatus Magnetomorum sp. HK-1]
MKIKIKTYCFVVFFLLLGTQAYPATTALEGPTKSVEVGQFFSVNITINEIQNFYGATIDLVFDGNIIQVDNSNFTDGLVEGSLLSEHGTYKTLLLSKLINKGRLTIGIVREGNTSGVSINQKQTLLTISFIALKEGNSFIKCDTVLSNLKNVQLEILETAFLDINIVASGFAPETPYNPYPASNSENVSTKTILSWNSNDNDSNDILRFDVDLDKSQNPSLIKSDHDTLNLATELLDYDTVYYWRVKAIDSKGVSKLSPVWNFKTFSSDTDEDSDGLTNKEEVEVYKTNPYHPDSDNDGFTDGWEVMENLNPLVNNNHVEKGDINGNGTVDLFDLILVLKHLSDIHMSFESINLNSDVDGNRTIDLYEAIYVLQAIGD